MNKLFLLGDSTCAIKEEKARPETGWGEMFTPFLKESWTLINKAKNGRSTEMALIEGIFYELIYELEKGDYVIIQYGHNESKPEAFRHTEPWTTYQTNLQFMIDNILKKGGNVILLSSIARRKIENGKIVNSHGDYPDSMKSVAKKNNLIFIDMNDKTLKYLNGLSFNESRELFMNFDANLYLNYPQGKEDNTHLRPKGASVIAKIVVQSLAEYNLPFLK